MKQFFTLFLLCLVLYSKSQVMPGSCTPTIQMVNTYKYDVVKTATVRLFETNSTYKDSATIPTLVKDSIAKAFYAVHNMPQSSLRDTIRNLFGYNNFNTAVGPGYYEFDSVHIYHNNYDFNGSYSPRRIYLYVRDTTSWAVQWQAGNYNNTVNPAINQLVLQYGLIVTGGGTFSNYISFICTSNLGINMFGLSKAFNAIINPAPGSGALPFYYAGDGNSIKAAFETNGIRLTYSNRCGDCPAGCQTGRAWTFLVSNDCSVQYLGATNLGSPLTITPPYLYTCTRGPVLPVTFGSITGYLQSGKPVLTWKVLTQLNVKEYVIERSDDGGQFYAVDKVPASTATTAEYNWKDAQALNGTAWFRIKAVDVDGRAKYSSIVKLSGSKSGGITIYPNPVQNHQITIQFRTPLSGSLAVRLYDISGKQVWNSSISLTPQTGTRTFALPLNLPAGIYSIAVQNEAVSYRQTLVVSNK